MNVEAHVTRVIADGGLRMSSGIVEEVSCCFGGGLCPFGLRGGEGTEGN